MAEIDLSLLFPKGQARPVGVRAIFPDVLATRSMKINPWIKHPRSAATVTKTDSDYQFLTHLGIRKPLLSEVALLGGYPRQYKFQKDGWARIGNSVPPMLIRAIALQIRHILFNGEPLIPYPKAMSYLEILESAWLDHLKPKMPDAPTVISTFAGGGGSSLGYSMAGYRELLAVEWDDNAVATFKLNFPDVPVYHGDIAKLSVEECLKLARIQPGELDLFDGSPPCQGFSTAGKRILDDPRNQLFREYVRLLRGLQPKVFLMENVSGMVKGKMKLVFAEIMRELKASGYKVSARLMNAMYFNVPQSRQRMIFIGVREDLGIEPSHPKGESRSFTVREALEDLDIKADGHQPGSKLDTCCRKLKPGQSADELFKNWGFQLIRLKWQAVAPTIAKSGGATGHIHPDYPRKLVGREYARLASYPDPFKFFGSGAEWQDRIGNSVPPLMIRSIARHIKQEILSKVTARDPIRLSE